MNQTMAHNERPVNVAILGAGQIAKKMAKTLNAMAQDERYATLIHPYGIAARSLDRAQAFAREHNLEHAFGSYDEMLKDPNIDLVYIATPHSLHAQQGIACMKAGKNILVEKPFAVNEKEAQALIDTADDTGMLCTEASWTRYMPSRAIIDELVSSGKLGEITTIHSNLCYVTTHKKRMTDPNLAGGALLDVGVYCLNFIDMVMGAQEIDNISSSMIAYPTGVDAQNEFTLYYPNGVMATGMSSMINVSDRQGVICGTDGYAICDNINDVMQIDIYNANHELVQHLDMPEQLTGFEYEVAAAANAIRNGQHECIEVTHADTLRIMAIMDQIRNQWGLTYPCEL